MSPTNWNSDNSRAYVFFVNVNGYLTNNNVDWTGAGLRPISFFNSRYLVTTKYRNIRIQDISLRQNL